MLEYIQIISRKLSYVCRNNSNNNQYIAMAYKKKYFLSLWCLLYRLFIWINANNYSLKKKAGYIAENLWKIFFIFFADILLYLLRDIYIYFGLLDYYAIVGLFLIMYLICIKKITIWSTLQITYNNTISIIS